MTHFTVLVCAGGPEEVDYLLAPYDENVRVAPRRSYEEGEASSYWYYESLKRDWEKALETPAGQDPELEKRARRYLEFSDPPTWAEVVRLHNAYLDEDGDERMYLDEELPGGPRAYTMTTYNPDSKWDWHEVGGRWRGSLRYRPGMADEVLNADTGPSESGFGFDPATISPLHCDGGPKRALDLEATRQEAEDKARKLAEDFAALTQGTPLLRPWAEFLARKEAEEGYTIEQARKDYHSQPGILALKDSDFRWADEPWKYQRPVDVQVAEARAAAIPGYALLRRDGTWLEPGRMGWWAMSDATEDSRALYREAANAYVDALPDDAWLVMVDCHI